VQTRIPDVLIIEPKVFTDERPVHESYNQRAKKLVAKFVQDNQSHSKQNVLRVSTTKSNNLKEN